MEKQLTEREQTIVARYMRQLGSRGGRTSAAHMTPAQRRARAIKASKAAAAKRKALKREAAHA
jgi:hypothetical protein